MGKGSLSCLAAIGVAIIVILILAVIGQEMNNRAAKEIASKPLYESTEYVEVLAGNMIKERLKDPDSYQFIEMNEALPSSGGEKMFVVTYRAKNGFGGYDIGRATFVCDKDNLYIVSIE